MRNRPFLHTPINEHREKLEGDRKGPRPTQHLPRPYNERAPLPLVVMVRAGAAERWGGDPCGRPRSLQRVVERMDAPWGRGKDWT